jgi:hypothetical protein
MFLNQIVWVDAIKMDVLANEENKFIFELFCTNVFE